MPNIQHKRGLKTNLPTSSLSAGELYLTTDEGTAHFPTDATTMIPLRLAVDEFSTLASISGAADLISIWDASESSNPKLKKITFDAFKTALNIPAGSSDELVAVVDGGTAGYIWGTDGTDGVIRMGSTLSWTKDGSDGFVTLNFDNVDCGTF